MKIKFLIIFLFGFMTSSFAQIKIKKMAELPKRISETSGLVLIDDKYFVTHNDGGNKSELFVLDKKGKLLREINIEDTRNKDWEDLTKDDEGNIYIGDFGNNDNSREKCFIYLLPRDKFHKKSVKPEKITFTYEDQKKFPPKKDKLNYDCEAFFWKDDKLYLFTKCRTKPYTGESRIYELPSKPGKYEAKYIGSIFLCDAGWRFCSVTSIDYDKKTNILVILTYSKLYFLKDFKKNEFWKGKLCSVQLPLIKQREAICIGDNKTLYLTDEVKSGLGGGNIYRIDLK